MKIYGKRGFEVSLKFIIMWIVLPIIAGLFILAIFSPVASAGPGMYKDDICRFNAGLVNKIGAGGRMVLFACGERSFKIDANNWKSCDPDGKFGFEGLAETDEYDAKRKCAAQQFYNLGKRCWYMFGNGGFKVFVSGGRHNCYRATVRDLGDSTIGEKEITEASIRADGCRYLQNKDPAPGCGNYDGMDFQAPDSTAIKTGGTYYICYDDRVLSNKQIDYENERCS